MQEDHRSVSVSASYVKQSTATPYIFSVSSYLLWLESIKARLLMLVTVCGCSGPSTLSQSLNVLLVHEFSFFILALAGKVHVTQCWLPQILVS